ncbi:MAG: helix-hairpin-helix domain-containing protein [Acidimicrobiales bacterium]
MPEHAPDPGLPVDPLAALRAADSRPLHEQWRDRVSRVFRQSADRARPALSLVLALLIAVFGGLLLWRSLLPTEPPIEDLLPFAPAAGSPTPAADTSATTVTPRVAVDLPTVVVHVAGAVERPGLIAGLESWRIADAVAAAGGWAPDADLDRINLAAHIADGQRIYVPRTGEAAIPAVSAGDASTSNNSGPIDLNASTAAALEALPGVGPATAEAIVAHREEHGAFGSVDALVAVRGIGSAKLDALRDHLVVR